MTPLELAKKISKILDNKKAVDLRVIGIQDISVLADYFVLASGTSSTHVKSLADEVEFQIGQDGVKPTHTEGYRSNSWIVLDYDGVIVHVFTPEAREFYDLDRLWQDGEPVDITAELE